MRERLMKKLFCSSTNCRGNSGSPSRNRSGKLLEIPINTLSHTSDPSLIFWTRFNTFLKSINKIHQKVGIPEESLVSCRNCCNFLEKSTTTSLESNKAAKLPLTILGVTALLGPIWLNKRLLPKEGFFSLISEKEGMSLME